MKSPFLQRKWLLIIFVFGYFCDYHCNSIAYLYFYFIICLVISLANFYSTLTACRHDSKCWGCKSVWNSLRFCGVSCLMGLLTSLSSAALPSILGHTTVKVTFKFVHLPSLLHSLHFKYEYIQVYNNLYIVRVYVYILFYKLFFQALSTVYL